MTDGGMAIAEPGVQIDLAHGDQRVSVVGLGGGLRSYEVDGRPLLDGFEPGERPTSGRGQVLAPWPNRIENGSYEFGGRLLQLPLTEPEHGNAIHGLVRNADWNVVDSEADRVMLDYVLEPQPGYPFTLGLSVEYALSDTGLTVRTAAWNLGKDPCPYGSGQHPYLTLGTLVDGLRLQVPARSVLISNERGLPIGLEAVEGTAYDFRAGRDIGGTVLDNGYTDLERDGDDRARVRLDDANGDAGISLWVDESYPYIMVFTEAQSRRRTDDMPPECVPLGRVADPARAGRVRREHVGDRAQDYDSGR
jgi:galactose mutarotase-like enzyme